MNLQPSDFFRWFLSYTKGAPMARQATRAELATAVIDLYTELTQIKAILTYLIKDESNEKLKQYIKQNAVH